MTDHDEIGPSTKADPLELVGAFLGLAGIGLLGLALADWLFYQGFVVSLFFR